MAETAVVTCSCVHKVQDKMYGNGKRLGNYTPKNSNEGSKAYRCTVCGSIKKA